MAADELVGVWRLLAYHELDEDGSTGEGPLGAEPEGILIYGEHGYMAVSMMRAGPGASAAGRAGPDGSGPPLPRETFMGYSGRWLRDGTAVVHEVEVSAHPHQVGARLLREAAVDGDRLTLHGTSVIGGRPRRRVLRWRRC